MVVEYVPAARPAMFAATASEAGAVAEAGESESHGAVVVTFQSNVPDPELEMVTVCAAGLLPPCVAEKARPVGLTLILEALFEPFP